MRRLSTPATRTRDETEHGAAVAADPFAVLWAHESVWCGVWSAPHGFELRLVHRGTVLRRRRFRDPMNVYRTAVLWLRVAELKRPAAGPERR
jgi:hypothetical protein